jgi:ubiquinone/menaquinone biosynthesis C-methylase UbiE
MGKIQVFKPPYASSKNGRDAENESPVNSKTETQNLHIYQREVVARNYDKSFIRDFRRVFFEETVKRLLQEYFNNGNGRLRVFEGGVGTGLFTIPVLRHLLNLDNQGCFVGLDNSRPMLEMLFNKPEYRILKKKGGKRVNIQHGDLEQPLNFPLSNFNFFLFAGVLHCLNDVYAFLRKFDRFLEKDGYLVMVFKTDSYTRTQCGEKFTEINNYAKYGNFWRYYHLLRDSYNLPADKRCRFIYDLVFINNLIQVQFNNRYVFQKSYKIPWFSATTFKKMVFAIENGLTFATGQGVSPEILMKLGEEMRAWILSNHLENTDVDIEHQMEVVVWKKTE